MQKYFFLGVKIRKKWIWEEKILEYFFGWIGEKGGKTNPLYKTVWRGYYKEFE